MLTMTEAAGGYVNQMLNEVDAGHEAALRLMAEPNGVKTALDTPRAGDRSFAYEGRNVVVVDEQTSEVLSSSTLDVEVTPTGKKLILA